MIQEQQRHDGIPYNWRQDQIKQFSFLFFFFFLFFPVSLIMKIESDIPHRTTSYQRLVEKLKRNPSERVDTKDWPRPSTPKEVIQHAIKGATSKIPCKDTKPDC